MHGLKRCLRYFTPGEWALFGSSVVCIVAAFCLFDRGDPLVLSASLVGVTSLLFNAKGNPIGQALMILFSLLYGIISYSFAYYGEMITYLGMTLPMAVFALVAWLTHPYNGRRAEVRVGHVGQREAAVMLAAAAVVTALFYFILKAFDTAHLPLSTLSVTTSFLAVYLTFRRSPLFALAYAANDVVLIMLWSLAATEERRFAAVVVCFGAFLVNDLYGYVRWRARRAQQT